LGGRERDDLEIWVIPEIRVEVVEISTRGTHDNDLFHKDFSSTNP
jgi:hypothetical protein